MLSYHWQRWVGGPSVYSILKTERKICYCYSNSLVEELKRSCNRHITESELICLQHLCTKANILVNGSCLGDWFFHKHKASGLHCEAKLKFWVPLKPCLVVFFCFCPYWIQQHGKEDMNLLKSLEQLVLCKGWIIVKSKRLLIIRLIFIYDDYLFMMVLDC